MLNVEVKTFTAIWFNNLKKDVFKSKPLHNFMVNKNKMPTFFRI